VASHVEAVTDKATKRLYFLKQFKRAGVPHAQLLHFYVAVIRPVREYAAPVWHHVLSKSQKNQTEAKKGNTNHNYTSKGN